MSGSRLLVLGVALLLAGRGAAAQQVSAGLALAGASYREQGSSLRFQGGGLAAHADLRWRHFGLRALASRIGLEPEDGARASLESFDMTQVDLALRGRVLREFSIEVGFVRRTVAPADAAQEVGAARIAVVADYALAPGASLVARAGYLTAARFSGGGSAPLGAELGLGASYGPGRGRIRATADFEFQHFGRRTVAAGHRLDVPIESAVIRLGIAFTR